MDETGSSSSRIFAALIALVALAGLTVQFLASFEALGSLSATTWVMLRYFTVITNLLVAFLFSALAAGSMRWVHPKLLGGVTLAIVLVGAVYWTLLRGLVELSGGALLADFILHTVTPILVPIYWAGFAPKSRLNARDPIYWVAYPLLYVIYAIVRGANEGRYAYPFLDGEEVGWGFVALSCSVIAICFLVTGYCFVWIDRRLA